MKIIIAGGGPAGIAASISASRLGADVTLIERYGFLGGMGTAGLVHPWMSYYSGEKQIIGGIFKEIVNLLKENKAFKDSQHLGMRHHLFDPEILKIILQDLALKAGVKLLLHTFVFSLEKKEDKIISLKCLSKSGIEKVKADLYIDATGDADLAYFAGVPYKKGRPKDKLMQPMTLHFRMGGVNEDKMPSREEINKIYHSAKKEGRLNNPRENLLWFDTVRKGEIHFNTTRVLKVDGTRRDDLTKAEIEGRNQMREIINFIINEIPGFEKAFLVASAPQIGVRETRRIIGHYIITKEDILGGRKFKDRIALGSYGPDIHNPKGGGTYQITLPPGLYYSIP
ncbi:MAG: FAD-dependent oxidoreductase, partial [Armatimonadetes bacterium]|nr:FAD-dependent oxidoreductase [Armatimonadota bacterium]